MAIKDIDFVIQDCEFADEVQCSEPMGEWID